MPAIITVETTNQIATLTLNRPERRNALSRELITQLTQAFTQISSDSNTRVVIVTGNGPAFCAGMDLAELQESLAASHEIIWQDAMRLAELFDLIYRFPKPTIAAINGSAVAGGAGLMSACDLAISVPTAKFGYPEVRRGLVAALVMPHLLRHVNERAARYLLLTGDLISAAEAAQMGLINTIVADADLLPTARRWAQACIAGGPQAMATTKKLLTHFTQQASGIAELAEESAAPRLGDECRAGLAAFFANQIPPWNL